MQAGSPSPPPAWQSRQRLQRLSFWPSLRPPFEDEEAPEVKAAEREAGEKREEREAAAESMGQ